MTINSSGAIAQLGERLPCTQEVSGSIPLGSTMIASLVHSEIRKMKAHLRVCFHLAEGQRSSLTMWICEYELAKVFLLFVITNR